MRWQNDLPLIALISPVDDIQNRTFTANWICRELKFGFRLVIAPTGTEFGLVFTFDPGVPAAPAPVPPAN